MSTQTDATPSITGGDYMDEVAHLFCLVCYGDLPPVGSLAACGVDKVTPFNEDASDDPHCALCEAVQDLPCPRCGS